MDSLAIALSDLAATERLAARVAGVVHTGDAILLEGDLGAGKTAFARAFLRALVDDPDLDVPSPSFTLLQTYDTPRGAVAHFDLWRLDGSGPLVELGWDDACEGIVLVEWPDRLGPLTPADALRIKISLGATEARHAILTGWTGRLEHLA